MRIAVVALACLLLGLVHQGSAIDCHIRACSGSTCESGDDQSGCDYCIKATAEANGREAVVKGCGLGSMPYDGCRTDDVLGVETETCYCDDNDLCNTATSHIVIPAMLVISIVTSFLLYA